jgi:hypothetical protein
MPQPLQFHPDSASLLPWKNKMPSLQVRVRLVRHTNEIPGVAGRPPRPVEPATREVEVSMTRETVTLSPLFYAALPDPSGGRVGYLKLAAFSQNAGAAVRDAIRDLKVRHRRTIRGRGDSGALCARRGGWGAAAAVAV